MPLTRNSAKAAVAAAVQGLVAGRTPHTLIAAVIASEGVSKKPTTSSISSGVGAPGADGRSASGAARIQVFQFASSSAASWRSGAAEALREEIGVPLPPDDRADYDRSVATARLRLDDAQFTADWEAGRGMRLEDAVAEALALAREIAAAGTVKRS